MNGIIRKLYDSQVNEGSLMMPVEFEEKDKLSELDKKVQEILGHELYEAYTSTLNYQLDIETFRAYKQGFSDSLSLIKEAK